VDSTATRFDIFDQN